MRNASIEIEKLSSAVGAEIHGVDLAAPLAPETFAEIRRAFHDHGVIFFRDQRLSPEQHIAFAERFGKINVNRFFGHVPGYPTIAEVRKEPDQTKNLGEIWHTDHSYDAVPALGSMLLAREVPPVGGDTMFASMIAAFDALSDGLKRTLETLRAEHSSRHVFGPNAAYQGNDLKGRLGNAELATQDAVHPVASRYTTSRIVRQINSLASIYLRNGCRILKMNKNTLLLPSSLGKYFVTLCLCGYNS